MRLAKPEEMFVYPRENDWEVWKWKTPPATPDSHAALHMVEDSCALEPLVSPFKTQAPAALLGFLISQLHKNELRPPPSQGLSYWRASPFPWFQRRHMLIAVGLTVLVSLFHLSASFSLFFLHL